LEVLNADVEPPSGATVGRPGLQLAGMRIISAAARLKA
jgi:hypothetical protein